MSDTIIKKIGADWKKLDLEEQRNLLRELEASLEKNNVRGERDNIYKRGKNWYYRFHFDGKDIRCSAGTSKEAARAALIIARREAELGILGKSKNRKLTLDEFESAYLEWAKDNKRSWARDELSLKHLRKVLGSVRLAEIDPSRVQGYKFERCKEVNKATVNREIACLRGLLNKAVELGKLDKNLLAGEKLMFKENAPRRPNLNAEEERRLLAASPEWLRFMMRLAIVTGCRMGELLALRWRNIDLEGLTLTVDDSKSGDSRRIPLSHPKVLAELRTFRGLPDGIVVMLPNGNSPEGSTVSHAFKRAARKIGKDELRFHDLRHIAGSRMQAARMTLGEVAEVLGHKTLAMARRYAQSDPKKLSEMMAEVQLEDVDERKSDQG